MDLIVANIPLEVTRKQEILECLEPAQRMYKVLEVLESEVEILELQKEIQGKVKDNIDQLQKEYYLREQLKVIQEELGEKDGVKADVEQYRAKMEELELSE